MIFDDKKANVLAAIIVGTVLLAGGALLLTQISPTVEKTNDQGRIVAQADMTMRQALSMGINDWLLMGFSDKLDVWYCNYPIPPELNSEVKPGLNSLTDVRVNSYLQNMRDQNPDYYLSNPTYVYDSEPIMVMNELNKQSMTAKVTEFKAGINTPDLMQNEDISKDYVYNYKSWLMYQNLYLWMQDDAGELSGNLQNLALRATNCQAIASACDCTDAEAAVSDAVINNLKLKKEHVKPALDASLQKLNDLFVGSGINCEYVIEKMHIENVEKREWAIAEFGPTEGVTKELGYREDMYNYDIIDWTADQDPDTLPYSEKALGGCPGHVGETNPPGEIERPKIITNKNVITDAREPTLPNELFESCSGTQTYWTNQGVEGDLGQAMKIAMIAMDKKVGLLLTVKCSDPSVSVETKEGYKPLASEIKLRVSLWQDCPVPKHQDDIYPEDKVQCPGGSPGCCFPAGTQVDLWDGPSKNIEDVKVGDYVKSYNVETGQFESSEVLSLERPIREGLYELTFENGDSLKLTNDHPLYTKKQLDNGESEISWAAVDPDASRKEYALSQINLLEIGDLVLNDNNEFVKITNINYIEGDVQTYTLREVSKNKNFFADGFLAHNQKISGILGIECPLSCGECLGCVYNGGDPNDDSNWECRPTPNLQCGFCSRCDTSGGCTQPNPGEPCGTGGCSICGENLGECLENPADATGLPCSEQPCATCSGTGAGQSFQGCNAPVTSDDITCNDNSNANRLCMVCDQGNPGSCIADAERVGSTCGNCAECDASGNCNTPTPEERGSCVTDHDKCWRCSSSTAGSCQIDLDLDKECGTCKRCAAAGGCEADPTVNGQKEGCGACKMCMDGKCVSDVGQNGLNCGGNAQCPKACQDGSCIYTNEGGNCGTTDCGLNKVCKGSYCTTEDKTKKCCGDAVCGAGDPCCNIGGWTCDACPPTT